MQKIKDKLDQIQTHLSSTEQVDPALKQEYMNWMTISGK